MHRPIEVLALAGLLGSGIMAGTFFAFSSFIMPALSRVATDQGLPSMQSINVAVIRPSFLGTFFGNAILCIGVGILAAKQWDLPGAPLFAAGAALYFFGTFVVTVAGNVPLNDALEAVDAGDPAAGERWIAYVRDWTRWNHLRTAAALLSTACFALGLAR